MNGADTLRLAFGQVRNRGLRSALTVTGVIIGVAAVVSLVSLGEGFRAGFESQLGSLGGQNLIVTPGFNRADDPFADGGPGTGVGVGTLTDDDVRAIRGVPGVLLVAGSLSDSFPVEYRSQEARLPVQGVDTSVWSAMTNAELEAGRLLAQGDRNVALVGHAVAHEFYDNDVTLNQQLTIEGRSFRVVGILEPVGIFGSEDRSVIIPQDALRDLQDDEAGDESLDAIEVEAAPGQDVDEVAAGIERALFIQHKVTEEDRDFTLLTAKEVQEEVDAVLDGFTFFLGSVAAISLLVGGIGIANTMFMAVLERSRQIGILKALGSTNQDVARLFLAESSLLGLIGGSLGLGLGIGISALITSFGIEGFGPPGVPALELVVTPEMAVYAILFALVVGAVSGLLPALRATRLQPVETLRAE